MTNCLLGYVHEVLPRAMAAGPFASSTAVVVRNAGPGPRLEAVWKSDDWRRFQYHLELRQPAYCRLRGLRRNFKMRCSLPLQVRHHRALGFVGSREREDHSLGETRVES